MLRLLYIISIVALFITILGGPGDLLSSYFYGVISTITPIRAPFRVLISLLTTYLLSPPTLQVLTKSHDPPRRVFGLSHQRSSLVLQDQGLRDSNIP